jgi:hypothetical protein
MEEADQRLIAPSDIPPAIIPSSKFVEASPNPFMPHAMDAKVSLTGTDPTTEKSSLNSAKLRSKISKLDLVSKVVSSITPTVFPKNKMDPPIRATISSWKL